MRQVAWILLFGLLAVPAWAKTAQFLISGTKLAFDDDRARHMILSKDCAAKLDCEAYRALGKASLKGIYPRGGTSPGAVACGKKLGGEVVIGKDSDGNENAFCRFGDGSMVSCGSITWHGRHNDLKRSE